MSRGGRRLKWGSEPTTTTNLDGIWGLNEINNLIGQTKWPRGPVAPTGLTAAAGNAQLVLSWTAPATTHGTITNYLIEYTPSGGSAQYVLTNSTSTSYTLTGLTNGTAYTVRVAAVNFTAGDYSATATDIPVAFGLFDIEYLVVAGGGGAGGTDAYSDLVQGGGGGAGGYRTGTITSYSLLNSTNVVVGAGGAGGLDQLRGDEDAGIPEQQLTNAANGSNSSLGEITSIGGGAGSRAWKNQSGPNTPASNGGSGGGGGRTTRHGAISPGGTGTAGQGNNGAGSRGDQGQGSGGGGGAGSAGSSGTNLPAIGGAGVSNSITGSNVVYAAGGSDTRNAPIYAQDQNTGHGGTINGGDGVRGNDPRKAGKKGVVILAYPSSEPALTNISAGLTYTVSTTSRSGFRVYTFTNGSGNIQFSQS